MIPRREAEDQAQRCLNYHVGAYALTVATLAVLNARSFRGVAGAWGLGVVLHGVLLHAIPETRELILRTTAAGMESRRAEPLNTSRMAESTSA